MYKLNIYSFKNVENILLTVFFSKNVDFLSSYLVILTHFHSRCIELKSVDFENENKNLYNSVNVLEKK